MKQRLRVAVSREEKWYPTILRVICLMVICGMYTLYISTAFIIAQWRKKFRFLVRLDNDYHHGAVISLDELAMQQRTTGEHSSSAPA